MGLTTQAIVRRFATHLPHRLPSFWIGQLIALLCATFATILRYLIDPLVHDQLPVAFAYPFVLAASIWGGTWAGLSSLILSAALSDFFWMPPPGSFKLTAAASVPLVAFAAFGGFAIMMVGLYRALLQIHIESEQRATLLSHEIRHRANNLLGMVQAISTQTARNAGSVADHQAVFTQRLTALAQAEELFSETSGPLDLDTFLRHCLEPFGIEQFIIDGPPVSLRPYLGSCCALLFHELATNATKYGALSMPDGRVVVTWDIEDDWVCLEWQERGGPLVELPSRTGFGSSLLKTAFPPEFGNAKIDFNPDGVCCTVRLHLPTSTQPAGRPPSRSAAERPV